MVLVKMLMEIDPLPMRGSLVMTLVMISPSRREVSPAKQLRQSPRLIPPRFRLVAAEFRPVSLPTIFFQGKSDDIAEDGHRRPARWPMRQGDVPRGVGRAPHTRAKWLAPLWWILSPIFFINSKNNFREVLGLLECAE